MTGPRKRGRLSVGRTFADVLIAALLASSVGCGTAPDGRRAPDSQSALLVFAASDLQLALTEIAALHEQRTGTRVELVLGSTGSLAAQIENGAPADLFLAANRSFVDRLAGNRSIDPQSRRVYAHGRVAVVWSRATPAPADLLDLAGPAYRTISIANPEHAPYGVAAREALIGAGIWEAIQARLVNGENVAHAYQYVRTGNADVGLVALGLLPHAERPPHLVVPASLHAPLVQEGAIVRGSGRAAEAHRFLTHLLDEEGQAVLHRFGFEPPGR